MEWFVTLNSIIVDRFRVFIQETSNGHYRISIKSAVANLYGKVEGLRSDRLLDMVIVFGKT